MMRNRPGWNPSWDRLYQVSHRLLSFPVPTLLLNWIGSLVITYSWFFYQQLQVSSACLDSKKWEMGGMYEISWAYARHQQLDSVVLWSEFHIYQLIWRYGVAIQEEGQEALVDSHQVLRSQTLYLKEESGQYWHIETLGIPQRDHGSSILLVFALMRFDCWSGNFRVQFYGLRVTGSHLLTCERNVAAPPFVAGLECWNRMLESLHTFSTCFYLDALLVAYIWNIGFRSWSYRPYVVSRLHVSILISTDQASTRSFLGETAKF